MHGKCREGRFVWIAMFLGWLIPGAGHYYLGQRWKAIILFSLLGAMYFTGVAIADFQNIFFREPLYIIGGFCVLGFSAIAILVCNHLPVISEWYPYGLQLGCLYVSVASLLNAFILLDVYSSKRS